MTTTPRLPKSPIRSATTQAKRLIRIVIGFTVLVIGMAMIFLPGPAIVVIPIALAILATEFVWAEKLMKRLTDGAKTITNKSPKGRGG